MEESKLIIEKIKEIRKDLIGTGFEYFIEFIKEGTISLYHTSNFLQLFDTPCGMRRKSEKDLALKVDNIINEEKFDLTKYQNKEYIQKNKEAHEKAFPIYLKVHKQFNIPFNHLLSASYLNKK